MVRQALGRIKAEKDAAKLERELEQMQAQARPGAAGDEAGASTSC